MKNLTVTDWYRQFVRTQVQPGDLCIDATAGNGNDTALLCQLTGSTGQVLAFDIQEKALSSARRRLDALGLSDNCRLILDSHEFMENYAAPESVSCITFNLGYLPGSDHKTSTHAASTLRALASGLSLLKPGGLMTVCIYSGRDTGFEERDAVLSFVRTLDSRKYLVIQSEYVNRPNLPPIPVLIIRLPPNP